jgi:CBS-domain-containing membrane protein
LGATREVVSAHIEDHGSMRTSPAAIAAGRRVADAMVVCPKTHGPESGLEKIRAFFEDDHVHMALVVAPGGRLVTTIERTDLSAASSSAHLAKLGTLIGRTTGPAEPLDAATTALLREGRRRLAVVDDSGRLLGLLCLKKDGTGYCSDEGIRERAAGSVTAWSRVAAQVARSLRASSEGEPASAV